MSKHKYNVRSSPERRTLVSRYLGTRTYASLAERDRAALLSLLVGSGDLALVIPQVQFPLGEDRVNSTTVDFLCYDDGVFWVEEVKGVETKDFRRVRSLWAKYGPCAMHILKRKGNNWSREVIPGGKECHDDSRGDDDEGGV